MIGCYFEPILSGQFYLKIWLTPSPHPPPPPTHPYPLPKNNKKSCACYQLYIFVGGGCFGGCFGGINQIPMYMHMVFLSLDHDEYYYITAV